MSWGFFVSLELRLPTKEWQALLKKAPKDCPVPADWPDESPFGQSFRSPYWLGRDEPIDAIMFAKSPSWKALKKEALREVASDGGATAVRFLTLVDKSLLGNASVVAAVFYGARTIAGAEGKLVLVNDGTGPDENGWVHTLAKGRVKRSGIEDAWAFVDAYGPALYPQP